MTMLLVPVAVIAAGAWLRWAFTPVRLGYLAGRSIGRMQSARTLSSR